MFDAGGVRGDVSGQCGTFPGKRRKRARAGDFDKLNAKRRTSESRFTPTAARRLSDNERLCDTAGTNVSRDV